MSLSITPEQKLKNNENKEVIRNWVRGRVSMYPFDQVKRDD